MKERKIVISNIFIGKLLNKLCYIKLFKIECMKFREWMYEIELYKIQSIISQYIKYCEVIAYYFQW